MLWQFRMGEGDISFPYIFLLVDHLEWALIGNIGQQRVDSVLWQFRMGGDISFPYIFLLVDHFKWALIGDIGQQRVDSMLWQFQMGGGDNHQFYPGKSENLSSFQVLLLLHRALSFLFIEMKDQ